MSADRMRRAALLGAALALALAATGCPGADISGNQGNGGAFGMNMEVDGQVSSNTVDGRIDFAGNRTATAMALISSDHSVRDLGGEGGISAGRLRFRIGAPRYVERMAGVFDGWEHGYYDFALSPAGALGVALRGLSTYGDGMHGFLDRTLYNPDLHGDGTTEALDEVFFVFADRAVTLSGMGREFGDEDALLVIESLNLRLQRGWNAIHARSLTTVSDGNTHSSTRITRNDPVWVGWSLFESDAEVEDVGDPDDEDGGWDGSVLSVSLRSAFGAMRLSDRLRFLGEAAGR